MNRSDATSLPADVILLAAGKSTRLGGDIAKPWRHLAGKTVLEHALMRLSAHPLIRGGVIVVTDGSQEDAKPLAKKYGFSVAIGGAERADSVRCGLSALAPQNPDAVLIHDAARPFIPPEVIDRLMAALTEGHDAVIPALAAADSLKMTHDNKVTSRVDRNGIVRVQTPQAFRFAMIKSLHDNADSNLATDDSSLVEDQGGVVAVVDGDAMLDKITTQDDLMRAEALAKSFGQSFGQSFLADTKEGKQMETRMATGFDVHKFNDDKGPIMLGGIAIDHPRGFDAHSDGDVALHALTDAIYGTMADGDIGSHFPPSDDQWKDKDSAFFLIKAAQQLQEYGGNITFVDMTIIAEAPKITPHRDAIRTRLGELLNLSVKRISVKATTSEGLGFTGRREGIAVQAAVTVTIPTESEEN